MSEVEREREKKNLHAVCFFNCDILFAWYFSSSHDAVQHNFLLPPPLLMLSFFPNGCPTAPLLYVASSRDMPSSPCLHSAHMSMPHSPSSRSITLFTPPPTHTYTQPLRSLNSKGPPVYYRFLILLQ